MAPCCNNIVTPKMIRAGRVSVGDRIQFEDDYISARSDELSVSERNEPQPSDAAVSVQAEATTPVPAASSKESPAAVMAAGPAAGSASAAAPANNSSTVWSGQNPAPANAERGTASAVRTHFQPLPYSEMTSYMSNVSINGPMDSPSVITPQDPMTPTGFDSSIDLDAVQTLNGFLRTQIGRYMRIEQLIGSNTIQDRFGFLVGVGSNFIILQEITTGNIMVLDIFSDRLAYVYYSQPVLPNF